ncbi:MAG: transcriptional regulator GcvA [Arenicellales bacterium]|nr:transcriptional regulator GcvA [Arenicellales bacterium]
MSRRLPPLNSLRAFEAAARYLSFTKAAEELHVTAAAVSQQVKALEEYFEVQLFRRLTRALMLTDAGQSVLPLLQEGFDKLAEADQLLRNRQDERVLTVSVPPSFGAKWLVPRLDRFRQTHPEFDVRIDATDVKVDFKRDDTDIALRYGRGNYKGLVTESLLSEFVIPVCSPALLHGKHPLKTPRDLRHHILLHVEWKMENEAAPNWRMWLRAAGVEDIDSDRGPRFSLETMAVQAAGEGQGVALASSALVEDDIASGRLVRPFPDTKKHETEFCYYVVYPKIHLERSKVKAFRDWVISEVKS